MTPLAWNPLSARPMASEPHGKELIPGLASYPLLPCWLLPLLWTQVEVVSARDFPLAWPQ